MNNIHILGASGVGTSTLGVALSKHLPHTHLDTDDYYWTDKFTKKREIPERRKLLEKDLTINEKWILSGAVCGWGDDLKVILTLSSSYGFRKIYGLRD